MTAAVIRIGSSPKLRGRQPHCGWGFYIDGSGAKRWLCKTRESFEATERFCHLVDSGWWAQMKERERVAFHVFNSRGLDAEAALDYRRYIEYTNMETKQSDKRAADRMPAKNKTPSGGNR